MLLDEDRVATATATYPSIVPPNDLRLPDALTIKHGPAPLLARFVLRGDRAVRDMGIRLRIRDDFDELAYINKQEVAKGTWFPLINMFHPDYTDLAPENSFWLSGEDDSGNIVLTWAARVFYWPDSSLRQHAGLFLCEKTNRPYPYHATPEAAAAMEAIRGVVFWGGSLWIHPDFRHHRLSQVAGRLGRAFAVSRWPLDWIMCFVQPPIVQSGVAAGYGYRHMTRGIFFPGSVYGDLEVFVVSLSAEEAYEDFAEFMAAELAAASASTPGSGMRRLQTVTRTSSVDVFQGSSSLS